MKEINKIYKSIAQFGVKRIMACAFSLICCMTMAQVKLKKNLTETEYSQWGTLGIGALSETGKWVYYKISYENNADTLFVKSTYGNKKYAFPKGSGGKFLKSNVFACLTPTQGLNIINLDTQEKIEIPEVTRFDIVNNGKYIITLNNTYGVKSTMQIRDENGKIVDVIDDVAEYALNNKRDQLVYSCSTSDNHKVGLIDFNKYTRVPIISEKQYGFHALTWQRNGSTIAFFKEIDSATKSNAVILYRVKQNKTITLVPQDIKEISQLQIVNNLKLSISDDGTKVFFGVTKRGIIPSDTKDEEVEIWNGNAPWVYPMEKNNGNWENAAKLSVWFPDSNSCVTISSNDLPDVQLTGKQDYVLNSNPKSYAPHYKLDGDVDYYITDIKKNTRSLFLKQQSSHHSYLSISPYGNQIAYYRDDNWWLYDPDKDKHVNLTKDISTIWDSRNDNLTPPILPYNCPGWSSDGKYLFLYDTYDIWIAALDGGTCRRLTHGREKNIVFRISQFEFSNTSSGKYDGKSTAVFDLSAEIILEATDKDDCSTGYFIWNSKEGEKPLAFNDSAISQLRRSKNNTYAFIEQKFNMPPILQFKLNKSAKSREVFASNPQQQNYYWGKSELIYYTNKKGQSLKGVLLYPSDFDKGKKYPMVAHIYQTKSGELHQYVNPSQYNDEGFNVTNYTLNGYFVLLPDIVYELGSPGASATECVLAAVKKVTDMGFVDPKKIGLIGHSFGGYETDFIITQTDIFSAAISGAGISDTVGWYFSIGEDIVAPQAWRFEDKQFRMGKTFYEDKENYFRNSPILNAVNIKTPLLQWCGKADQAVSWEQSVVFYTALRRLQKKHMMLVYPDESHAISKNTNQKDLTLRVQQWFDYYLKNQPPATWISVGTTD